MSKAIGEIIKDYRKKAKMNQQDLANAIGVSHMSIRRYENGERTPRIEIILKIAEILKISVSELIGNDYLNEINRQQILDAKESLKQSEVMTIVGEVFDPEAENMLAAYSLLNQDGKNEAFKRVTELTEISRYRQFEDLDPE